MTIVKRLWLHGWRKDKEVECLVQIDIDDDKLAYDLGNRAFRNTSKKSRASGGIIKCVVRPVGEP
jgi:hypothetical protein